MTITETLNSEEQQVADLVAQLLAEFPPKEVDVVTFLGAQFDKGLAWVHFPVGHGGSGSEPEAAEARQRAHLRKGCPQPDVPQPDRPRHVRPHRGCLG